MKVCIRPFGIGVEDMDSSALKEKGKNAFFITLGVCLVVGEVATRHTANALTVAANAVADAHAKIVVKQGEVAQKVSKS